MSNPYLPPEILDCIVDLLHDDPDELKECCLTSKSWIPRIRKHLFTHVRFDTEADLESWKETFPDPSTSPAHYAKSLRVDCLHVVTAADADAGGWIRGFSRVVKLELNSHSAYAVESGISLVPFHGLSPAIKSLRIGFSALPPSMIFNLTLSFPLLEDLILISGGTSTVDNGDGPDALSTTIQPPNLPVFSGSLELPLVAKTIPIARLLISLTGGIHIRKLVLTWGHKEGFSLAMALVEGCSDTLESLHITRRRTAEPRTPVNLSKVTTLKDVTFRVRSWSVEWITMTLQTMTPKHRDLRQISIDLPFHLVISVGPNAWQTTGETIYGQWLDFDHLLVQFWESRSIRLRVMSTMSTREERAVRDLIGRLLPEITRRGIVDLVQSAYGW